MAYWLENPTGARVTPLYRSAHTPMVLLGNTYEKLGNLDGWSLVRRDTDGSRHIVVAGPELAELARAFLPQRTPEEAAALAPFFSALRRVATGTGVNDGIEDDTVR